MTGILLPPGLTSAQTLDPQQLRTGLSTLDKVALLQPVLDASKSGVQNSTDQAIRNSQAARAANGQPGQNTLLPGASTRESLSFAARAILTLMDGTPPQPLRSAGPVLPAPPTAGSSAAVATALAALVDESGLFYESHLSQWVAGARPLASILQQPQAPLGQPAQPNAPFLPPGAKAGPDAPMLTYSGPSASSGSAPPDLPRAPGPTIPASQLLAEALAAPGNPRVAHSHAPAEQGVRQGTGSHSSYSKDASPADGMPSRPSAGSVATQAYQPTADAARAPAQAAAPRHSVLMDLGAGTGAAQQQAPQDPAIHPSTEATVRQQLELLATQQFRFAGEAWPGTPMEWDITRRDDGTAGQDASDAARQWSSRLQLQLPRLGLVEVVLTLGPNGLEARLATAETDVAARFIEARPQLRNQLEAQGIVLRQLNVETRDSMDDGGTA
ncbi:flagellar hook-length control protein FliK [Cupriavidus sp. WKF15]|uniref:flagellar hook-length control protein FliK n=1 Tax=Cupriavidus sp. WKF15 TaxID=3032282 RepID=UPI0023E124C7|nr:flagellar hook-length control protein FliK [Cupriavidus sp. WKF15]WER49351.1 flagellar hook-length control protein FliK [Cupriavidus sp. WKF15]